MLIGKALLGNIGILHHKKANLPKHLQHSVSMFPTPGSLVKVINEPIQIQKQMIYLMTYGHSSLPSLPANPASRAEVF